jgi:hypothetical protein
MMACPGKPPSNAQDADLQASGRGGRAHPRGVRQRTGLAGAGSHERTIFQLEGADRPIDALGELDAIDPSWDDHVRLENPQT